MSAYRVGHHQPQNVYRGEQYIGVMFSPIDAAAFVRQMNRVEECDCESYDPCQGECCGVGMCSCSATPEDAALVVEALNAAQGPVLLRMEPPDLTPEQLSEFREAWQESLGAESGEKAACGRTNPHMPHDFGEMFDEECAGIPSPEPADSCTCPTPYRSSTAPDPACPVHQGRRARGPKPPPLGPGCICDGSGRTCPRHGAVM